MRRPNDAAGELGYPAKKLARVHGIKLAHDRAVGICLQVVGAPGPASEPGSGGGEGLPTHNDFDDRLSRFFALLESRVGLIDHSRSGFYRDRAGRLEGNRFFGEVTVS